MDFLDDMDTRNDEGLIVVHMNISQQQFNHLLLLEELKLRFQNPNVDIRKFIHLPQKDTCFSGKA